MPLQYFAVYKPYLMLCQFTPEVQGDITLASLPFDFPKDCYTIGRLDKDSEGLLMLSNDNFLKTRFLSPKHAHTKTYYVQVEGIPTEDAITQLSNGVNIRIKKKVYRTARAKVETILPPTLPERTPPIRFRANIPTSWLKMSITEGKNRQIRRMCASVGFPVLRLVRFGLEQLTLADLDILSVTSLSKKEVYQYLKINS